MMKTYNFKLWRVRAFLMTLTLAFSTSTFAQDNDSDILFQKARLEGQKLNFAKAEQYCQMALDLAPLDMDIKEYLGKCQMELGKFDEARVTLLDVLKKSPKRVEARHYLLNIEYQTQRYSSAVCYANELLEITPYAKTLWMKKIQLYSLMNNKIEARRATERLYHVFPDDEEVRALYNSILKEDALIAAKSQDHARAIEQYELALKAVTNDSELYLNLINAYIRLGNYDKALEVANLGLYYLPTNKAIFDKKIGVLEQKQDYSKAIAAVELKLKTSPSQEYATLLNYLLSESARYNRNSDPYELYGQLYARNPGNIEAYNYLLNTALARGYHGAAQDLISKGLKSNPNSKELLSKQLYLYEMQQNKDAEYATIAKLYELYPYDSDVIEKYNKLQYKNAKESLNNREFRVALPIFQELKDHPEYGLAAKNALYTIYLEQRRFDDALKVADELIALNPGNQTYIIKRIDVFAKEGDYDRAYDLALDYANEYPMATQYADLVEELSIGYIKMLQEQERYPTIIEVSDRMIFSNSEDKLAYLYGIGARLKLRKYQDAIDVAEIAMIYFPDDKDFKLRLAGIYQESGRIDDALVVFDQLSKDYPYNYDIRDSYVEALFLKGKQLEKSGQNDEAINVYKNVLRIKPNDTLAPIKIANLLIVKNELDAAMQVVDSGLFYHPLDNDLIFKKGLIYEKKLDYDSAYYYYKMYNPHYYQIDEHRDLLDFIEARQLKNQVNFSYLRVTTDSVFLQTSVATVEYLRNWKRNTIIARYNYAARSLGIGSQFELDWYHDFKDSSSILANIGVANQFFPTFKAGLSYYQSLGKSNETRLELGGRFLRFATPRNLWMGIVGLERTYGSVWVNLRGSVITDQSNWYNSIFGQTRFYMRNDRNYIVAQGSVGTIPEVDNVDFQLNTFLSYLNTMVGVGYFHHFNHRTSAGFLANWYTFRISEERIENLYHMFFTVRHRF